jgi:hypothetical protein
MQPSITSSELTCGPRSAHPGRASVQQYGMSQSFGSSSYRKEARQMRLNHGVEFTVGADKEVSGLIHTEKAS